MTYCSKIVKICLLTAALLMLVSCSKDTETNVSSSGKSVHIEKASYYYEQGYLRAGGGSYEMVLASDHQLSELEQLFDALVLNWTGEDFLVDQGYHLTWKDESGDVTRDMLLIDSATVSMEGILYDAQNAQPLFDWLEALEIDEQSAE